MEESRHTRKTFLKTLMLGSAACLLPQAEEVAAAEIPSDITLYTDEPSIGDSGYEQRVVRIFEQATVKKAQTLISINGGPKRRLSI